jgi:hypothetical protein
MQAKEGVSKRKGVGKRVELIGKRGRPVDVR